jgi:hypothetical protein
LAQAFVGRRLVTRSRWALLVLLGAAGCGVNDYEAQMAVEQQQVQRFDEETKYLAGPLEVPKLKSGGKEVDIPDVFFRPPRGVDTEAESTPGPPPYARYLGRGTGTSGERLGVSEVYFALGLEKEKDFATTAVRAFPQLSGVTAASRLVRPAGREPIQFSLYENSGSGFSLYLCQRGGLRLAIGFQTDKSTTAIKAVDLSLESLEVGPPAGKLRKAYADRIRRHH